MVIQGSKRIYKLDLLKGAACVGVVFTHVTFPGLGKAVHVCLCASCLDGRCSKGTHDALAWGRVSIDFSL